MNETLWLTFLGHPVYILGKGAWQGSSDPIILKITKRRYALSRPPGLTQ